MLSSSCLCLSVAYSGSSPSYHGPPSHRTPRCVQAHHPALPYLIPGTAPQAFWAGCNAPPVAHLQNAMSVSCSQGYWQDTSVISMSINIILPDCGKATRAFWAACTAHPFIQLHTMLRTGHKHDCCAEQHNLLTPDPGLKTLTQPHQQSKAGLSILSASANSDK